MKAFTSTWRALGATSAVLALALTASAQTIPPCSTGGGGGLIPASGTGGTGAVWQSALPATPGTYTLAATATAGSTCVTEVVLRGLAHTWIGDTQFVLEDPSANKYNLFCRPGFTGSGFGFSCNYAGDYTIVAACAGGGSLPTSCTTNLAVGTYEQSFGLWSGGLGIANTSLSSIPAATGTWTLYAYDWAGGDSGSLTSWEICFGTPPSGTAPTAAPTLLAPANAAQVVSPVALSWGVVPCATYYEVDIDGTVYGPLATPSYSASVAVGTHTWMARGANGAGVGPWSASRTFDEIGPPPSSVCATGDTVGGLIPASGTGGTGSTWPTTLPATPLATSAMVTTPAGATKIVKLVLHGLNHTWVGDLQVVLTDPSGVQHNILHRPGFTGTGVGCSGDPQTGDYSIFETYGGAIELGCPTTIPAGNYEQSFGTGAGLWPSGTNSIVNTALESIPILAGTNMWTVTIYDWAGGDTGSITGWDLCFDQVPVNVVDCQTLPTVTQTCDSTASYTGVPSAMSASPFTVTFSGLNAQVNGVVFYGITGPASTMWSPQSTLCIKAPVQRLNGLAGAFGNTGGVVGNCDGSYSFNMNDVIQGIALNPSNGMPYLGAPMMMGATVDMQAWERDPASSKTTNLSDALSFTVGP